MIPWVPPALTFWLLPLIFRGDRGGPAEGEMEIVISGPGGGSWALDVRSSGVRVARGPARDPACRLLCSSRTWAALASGRITGTEAFMRGRIEVQGDLGLSLKLDACFA